MSKNVIKNEKGFTLVELIIVVVILGVLAATGVTMYGNYSLKAKVQADFTNAKNIADAIQKAIVDGEITAASGFTTKADISEDIQDETGTNQPLNAYLVSEKYLAKIPEIKAMNGSMVTDKYWELQIDVLEGDIQVWAHGVRTGNSSADSVQLYPKQEDYSSLKPYDQTD